MQITKYIVASIIATSFTTVTFAADISAGQQKAASCAGCHGAKGISSNPAWPNLAGQQVQYLEKQLRSFRSGTRQDPLMSPMAKALSDNDISNLAAYFSSLK